MDPDRNRIKKKAVPQPCKQCMNNNRNQYQVIEKKEEKNEDNGTEEQNGNKMQEIAELPNVAETLYPFIGKGRQNKKEQKNEDNGTEEQNNKKIEEKLYSETLYPSIHSDYSQLSDYSTLSYYRNKQ